MARRPFDPAAHGLDQNRVPAGRHPRPRCRRRSGRRRRHRRPSGLHHHGFARGERPGQPGGNPQRVRGDGGGRTAPGGWCTPRRWRPTATTPTTRCPITEDVPTRGSPEHYYSEQKAACEAALTEITAAHRWKCSSCGRASSPGPKAPALAEAMPWNQLPDAVRKVSQAVPLLKPPFPDPGTPVQLVHHDDVAAAIALAATTSAPPGAYNLAGDGLLSMSDVAEALGARPVRGAPHRRVGGLAGHGPAAVRAVGARVAARRADDRGDGHRKARSQLGWTPKYTAAETLSGLAESL